MGLGGLLSFVGLAIELLIAGSHAADRAGFQLSRSGSKKTNSYHFPFLVPMPLSISTRTIKERQS